MHSVSAVAHAQWPRSLSQGWTCTSTLAGACTTPLSLDESARWIDAPVPGTIASALRANGMNDDALSQPFAMADHWYRLALHGNGARRLRFHGLATIAEVWLDNDKLLASDSMFVAHDVDVELDGDATLYVCFRSIQPALAAEARATGDVAQCAHHVARPYARMVPADAARRSVAGN